MHHTDTVLRVCALLTFVCIIATSCSPDWDCASAAQNLEHANTEGRITAGMQVGGILAAQDGRILTLLATGKGGEPVAARIEYDGEEQLTLGEFYAFEAADITRNATYLSPRPVVTALKATSCADPVLESWKRNDTHCVEPKECIEVTLRCGESIAVAANDVHGVAEAKLDAELFNGPCGHTERIPSWALQPACEDGACVLRCDPQACGRLQAMYPICARYTEGTLYKVCDHINECCITPAGARQS